ncbi:MAG: prolipoprotein diacylglyceryl transferase [Xanthomonadales bacterium]|nr:prolipoprotein diacylglyceryl transferase [Xanthomonadales bacterium]
MQSDFFLVNFDPVALRLGPLSIHWYGVMYLLAFVAFWILGARLARSRPWAGWTPEMVSDFLFYGMLGVIIGGRLGYVFFYAFDSLLADPLFLVRVWDGGMSFHGGLLGVIVAMVWYGRKTDLGFWRVADFVAPLVPLGLMLGRIGNFIGGELWGRASDAPWAMIFPGAVPPSALNGQSLEQAWASGALDAFARHPSQLYQAALEGLALFVLLMLYSARPRPVGAVSGLFLLGYGVMRFAAEFFREPDAHLGFLAAGWLTMGMLLSLPMIIAGILIMARARDSVSRD